MVMVSFNMRKYSEEKNKINAKPKTEDSAEGHPVCTRAKYDFFSIIRRRFLGLCIHRRCESARNDEENFERKKKREENGQGKERER